MGVNIKGQPQPDQPPVVEVTGVGLDGLKEPENVLDAGNSGTTTRLLTGLLAAQPFLSIITGDSSLRSRPMKRVIAPLQLMGAQVWARGSDSLAPVVIRGSRLHGITYSLPVASAQVKSAIMLAALFAQGTTSVEEPQLSRDHTERMLKSMGVSLKIADSRVEVAPLTAAPPAIDLVVPGDISSAAYWLVAGAIHPRARIKVVNCGINPTRAGLIEALQAMGAVLKIENERRQGEEPIADIQVESSQLRGIDISGKIVPHLIDEIPVLAVAASIAKGTTTIRGAEELRVKESDRIDTTVRELSKMGAKIEALPDGMIIKGVQRLHGAEVNSHEDHRLAMSLGIAALAAQGVTSISGAEAVDISYPGFWEELGKIIK
jgi:3-phosphoshikimate 1-carboxyvinyltransferase